PADAADLIAVTPHALTPQEGARRGWGVHRRSRDLLVRHQGPHLAALLQRVEETFGRVDVVVLEVQAVEVRIVPLNFLSLDEALQQPALRDPVDPVLSREWIALQVHDDLSPLAKRPVRIGARSGEQP